MEKICNAVINRYGFEHPLTIWVCHLYSVCVK